MKARFASAAGSELLPGAVVNVGAVVRRAELQHRGIVLGLRAQEVRLHRHLFRREGSFPAPHGAMCGLLLAVVLVCVSASVADTVRREQAARARAALVRRRRRRRRRRGRCRCRRGRCGRCRCGRGRCGRSGRRGCWGSASAAPRGGVGVAVAAVHVSVADTVTEQAARARAAPVRRWGRCRRRHGRGRRRRRRWGQCRCRRGRLGRCRCARKRNGRSGRRGYWGSFSAAEPDVRAVRELLPASRGVHVLGGG
mmetsp:Transcript_37488/g.96956  ORF Transcript_37488/g.96956 Transcript_37488/m.96956 type:complete len:253 (+) Transcript_37488:272-1030(+)